jgi:hypothetical protein
MSRAYCAGSHTRRRARGSKNNRRWPDLRGRAGWHDFTGRASPARECRAARYLLNPALIFLGVGGGGTVTELLREFPQQRPFLSGRGVGPDQVPRLRFTGIAVRYRI